MSEILARMVDQDFEQVMLCCDEVSGLRALIAIHDTTLGPAVGGVRMQEFDDDEAAVREVMALSRAMTWKAAAAGLDLGGGKAIIIGNPESDKSEALLRAFGRYVESMNGRYFAATDVGIDLEDLEIMHLETQYVTGLQRSQGGSDNPAPKTALSVFRGIGACLEARFGQRELRDRRVLVQGLGRVGYELARLLAEAGARVIAADPDLTRIDLARQHFDLEVVAPEQLLGTPADVLAPCAFGGILNEETIPRLQVSVVAGCANNQLASERHADLLHQRGILYAPDFVINAGGLINVAEEFSGYNEERAVAKINRLIQHLERILAIAKERNLSTHQAAKVLARERIATIREVRRTFIPSGYTTV